LVRPWSLVRPGSLVLDPAAGLLRDFLRWSPRSRVACHRRSIFAMLSLNAITSAVSARERSLRPSAAC